MHHPLVSVILPVYNGERYLAEALDSVFAQTYQPLEVVCVDDGSTDGTRALILGYGERIRFIGSFPENRGIAAGRNACLAEARGDFFALMDGDDVWDARKIETQMQAFAEDPELGVSFTHMRHFISPELPDEVKRLRHAPPGAIPGRVSATAVMRREAYERVGPFDDRFRVGEFIDWFSRAEDLGVTHATLPIVGLLRRVHDANTGVVDRAHRKDYARIMLESLARKRKAS